MRFSIGQALELAGTGLALGDSRYSDVQWSPKPPSGEEVGRGVEGSGEKTFRDREKRVEAGWRAGRKRGRGGSRADRGWDRWNSPPPDPELRVRSCGPTWSSLILRQPNDCHRIE